MFPLQAHALGFAAGEKQILDGVDLRLERGSFTAVLGPNGAGKSVLMRLLHGLLVPTTGRVQWGGLETRPAQQAMLFQRPVMLRRSVLGNVIYGLHVQGVAAAEARQRAQAALARVGLVHLADRPARVLSGGEQQRVALARAVALEPAILFLDEPTASLDPVATRAIEATLAELHAQGTTIVMVTHHLGQARRLAQDIVFVQEGRVTEHTPATEFFRQPRSTAASDFLQEELP
ncbi:MAG: ATP-binding cassette domain-containing protein [Rhodocyclaceae bacterium]|nr:ATP-binding cassette domain-containing protein [Rhodocyclaceae bacterium]